MHTFFRSSLCPLLLDWCGAEERWRGGRQASSWAAYWELWKGERSKHMLYPCVWREVGGALRLSNCLFAPALCPCTKWPSSKLLHEEWRHMGSQEDTSSVGCLGYGIMLRSSWYFWTFSVKNRDHCRLQPLLTTGCPRPCQHLQELHICTPSHWSAPTPPMR